MNPGSFESFVGNSVLYKHGQCHVISQVSSTRRQVWMRKNQWWQWQGDKHSRVLDICRYFHLWAPKAGYSRISSIGEGWIRASAEEFKHGGTSFWQRSNQLDVVFTEMTTKAVPWICSMAAFYLRELWTLQISTGWVRHSCFLSWGMFFVAHQTHTVLHHCWQFWRMNHWHSYDNVPEFGPPSHCNMSINTYTSRSAWIRNQNGNFKLG